MRVSRYTHQGECVAATHPSLGDGTITSGRLWASRGATMVHNICVKREDNSHRYCEFRKQLTRPATRPSSWLLLHMCSAADCGGHKEGDLGCDDSHSIVAQWAGAIMEPCCDLRDCHVCCSSVIITVASRYIYTLYWPWHLTPHI